MRAQTGVRPRAVASGPLQGCRSWLQRAGGLVLVTLFGLVLAGTARADCSQNWGNSSTVTFALPSTLTVANNVAPGTILYTSPTVSPSNPQTLFCMGATSSGIVNSIGAPPGSDNTLFPTNVAGVSYRILHPDTGSPLHAYPNEPVPQGLVSFSVASALQLVATGSIPSGSQLAGGQIAQWNIDRFALQCSGNSKKHGKGRGNNCTYVPVGPQPVQLFNIPPIRFVTPACSVTTDPTLVTLPPVLSSQFAGTGSTTGTTPFAVQLSCANVTALTITLQTNTPVPGTTGVIASTTGTGYAQGVGVQLLDHNSQPVPFGTAMVVGGAQSGAVSIAFFARYYQTAGTISGGQVSATATYTLSYP